MMCEPGLVSQNWLRNVQEPPDRSPASGRL